MLRHALKSLRGNAKYMCYGVLTHTYTVKGICLGFRGVNTYKDVERSYSALFS
jgi:hypothetical protein